MLSIPILSLPQKLALSAVGALLFLSAILGGVWFIYSQGAQAAEAKAEKRHLKELADHKKVIDDALDKLQTELSEKLDIEFATVGTRLGQIDTAERTIIRPTLIREIQNDPRLSDPDFTLPDGVRAILNKARAESACPERATGGDCATLSRAPATN